MDGLGSSEATLRWLPWRFFPVVSRARATMFRIPGPGLGFPSFRSYVSEAGLGPKFQVLSFRGRAAQSFSS